LTLEVRQRLGESAAVVALLGVAQGRPLIVVAVNTQAQDHGIAAGSLVRMAAQTLGGGGGGKADIAQGGGSDPQAISDAVNKLTDELKQHG
ncbi:MAG TPA: DHHA1 domain-containing protein, partial [Beutenbergiaceae bacterium]|nr:DHHA1 domain-containing protein [Beutenbergiaceae bacterium]